MSEDRITLWNILKWLIARVWHLGWIFIRGTLFYFCKLLYFLFNLEEFEKPEDQTDDIVEIIDDLNHTFNFQRSSEFKKIWDDYNFNLESIIPAAKTDACNGNTEWTTEIKNSIEIDVKKLIIMAEKEASNRTYRYYCRSKGKNISDFQFNEMMYDEMLSGYDNTRNDLSNAK